MRTVSNIWFLTFMKQTFCFWHNLKKLLVIIPRSSTPHEKSTMLFSWGSNTAGNPIHSSQSLCHILFTGTCFTKVIKSLTWLPWKILKCWSEKDQEAQVECAYQSSLRRIVVVFPCIFLQELAEITWNSVQMRLSKHNKPCWWCHRKAERTYWPIRQLHSIRQLREQSKWMKRQWSE